MYKTHIARSDIQKFLRCWDYRVDELFACGAIVETSDDIYDKQDIAKAFEEESYIKGTAKRPRPRLVIPPRDISQSVYFVQDGDAIKIGIGMDPAFRLTHLQVGNPRLLTLLGSYKASRTEESALHERFKSHHIRGEWFRDHPALRELIAARCHANDNAPASPTQSLAA